MSTPASPLPPPSTSDGRATVIGINFGNSYASIAVITKEGKAECIANEDGERQIAAAISFHGEELYIGNQAMPQLVKNAQNTITGFRNLLGKKFSEIAPSELEGSLAPSAPLIQHPTIPDTPCYSVQVLVPSPAPLLSTRGTSTPTLSSSRPSTQHPTPLATPRSEPMSQTRLLTPHDAATLFLKSLHQSATDFLGKTPSGTVLTVPAWFTEAQREALREAAKEAGVTVLQLLDEDTAAASVLLDEDNEANRGNGGDRTALLVDWGATDLTVSLLSIRAGLVHILATKRAPELGTARPGGVDEALVKHFAKEFTKKTSEALQARSSLPLSPETNLPTLQVCPPTSATSRAQTKLALALPHVKRSLTTGTPSNTAPASSLSKSTQISIESLHSGLDFSAALNRTRASGLLSSIFMRFVGVVRSLLESAGGEGEAWAGRGPWVDTVVWVGGGGRMAGANEVLLASGVLGDDVRDEDVGAAEEALARGCAIHGRNIAQAETGVGTETDVDESTVLVTRRTLGVLLPEAHEGNGHADADADNADDMAAAGVWIPVVHAETPLPTRRTVRFAIASRTPSSPSPVRAAFEVWEVAEVVKVQLFELSDVEEDFEPEEEHIRSVRKERYLGVVEVPLTPAPAPAGKTKGGKGKSMSKVVEVRFDVGVGGKVEVGVREEEGEWVRIVVGA
ncbi:actin-like ATPase domain-containing protein [Ramaria rubella]|nr:actin-like ATPase domain-containing protein [Ramaria rubella]